MIYDIDNIFRLYLEKGYGELLGIAKESLVKLLPACRTADKENDGYLILTALVLASVGIDGRLTKAERAFLSELMGLDVSRVEEYAKMYTGKEADTVDKLADALTNEYKASAISFVLAVAACDGDISVKESDFIKKLIE